MSAPSCPAAVSPRLPWLDFFRGAAVLLMIETHVANTFLQADLQASAWFARLTYLNGLVAPSFLFIAGFSLGLAWRHGSLRPDSMPRRFRRLCWIALLGYGLHFPFPQLWRGEWAEALRLGTQVDVLPCLAVSMAVLLLISWGIQSWKRPGWSLAWGITVAALALPVIAAAPGLAAWGDGPILLRAFVNASTGSLFPLFPWAGFVFCGALIGAWNPGASAASGRFLVAFAVIALGRALSGDVFSAVGPAFFLERLGWVMALALGCEALIRERPSCLTSFAGRESLLMYAGHLSLIFFLADAGIVTEREQSLPETLAWVVVVTGLTFAMAFVKARWGELGAVLRRFPVSG